MGKKKDRESVEKGKEEGEGKAYVHYPNKRWDKAEESLVRLPNRLSLNLKNISPFAFTPQPLGYHYIRKNEEPIEVANNREGIDKATKSEKRILEFWSDGTCEVGKEGAWSVDHTSLESQSI